MNPKKKYITSLGRIVPKKYIMRAIRSNIVGGLARPQNYFSVMSITRNPYVRWPCMWYCLTHKEQNWRYLSGDMHVPKKWLWWESLKVVISDTDVLFCEALSVLYKVGGLLPKNVCVKQKYWLETYLTIKKYKGFPLLYNIS